MTAFIESVVERAALTWLESIDWRVAHGSDVAPDTPAAERRDYSEVVLPRRLRDALRRLNPELPAEALKDAFRKLTRPEGADLVQRNRALHRMLVDGVTVEYRSADGAIRGAQARVLDFDDPANNDWLAVNQFAVVENKHSRRADVVLFVNGLPLAVIELKNPADEDATIWTALQQLQTYQAEIPSLFAPNAVLVVSDGVEARVGTLTAGREWFKPWRTIGGEVLRRTPFRSCKSSSRGCSRSGAFSTWCATSSSSKPRAAGGSSRRWPATISSTRSGSPWPRRYARRTWCGARSWRKPAGATRPARGPAAGRATGASAWSGTPRAPARA
jgi:hypothetical protein